MEFDEDIKGLYAIDGNDDSAWAVGSGGQIVGYLNGKWGIYYDSPTTDDLEHVAVHENGEAWAHSEGNELLHWNGTTWSVHERLVGPSHRHRSR